MEEEVCRAVKLVMALNRVEYNIVKARERKDATPENHMHYDAALTKVRGAIAALSWVLPEDME